MTCRWPSSSCSASSGLRAGRVVFDGTPAQLTESALTDIYGSEDWTAMRKDHEDDKDAEADALRRLSVLPT